MSLNLKDKETIVTTIRKITNSALAAVVADFRGVTVDKITELRKTARELGVYIRVVRNSLLIRAIKGTIFECLKDILIGPTMIAYSMKNPRDAALLFKEFARKNTNFEIKAAAFNNRLIVASEIDRLATLPTYKEAVSRLIVVMKEASIGKLISILIAVRDAKANIY